MKPQDIDVRRILKLRRDGTSVRDIAEQTGVSKSQVQRIVARRSSQGRKAAPVATPAPAAVDRLGRSVMTPAQIAALVGPEEPAARPEPLSDAQVCAWLDENIGAQRDAANLAHSSGDQVAFQRSSKSLIALVALRARTRPSEDEAGFVRVRVEELRAEGDALGAKMNDLLSRAEQRRETWPRCPACGQPVPPEGHSP